MTTLSIVDISNLAELEALADAWWELWEECPAATPFQSPAWLIPWWRSFAPGELRLAAVRRGGRLVGLAPLYLEVGTHGRRLLPIGVGISDFLDLMISPDGSIETLAGLSAHLATASDWDSCELSDLGPGACALRLPCPPQCKNTVQRSESCPVLVLPHPDRLAEVIPAGQRRDARQARNRMARRDRVAIGRADHVSTNDMLAALVRLHRCRWETRALPGVLGDPRVVRFHQQSAPLLADRKLACFHYVSIDGVLVAVQYSLLHRHRCFAYLSGFDPTFAFESPGTILIDLAIREAAHAGAREFHFLRGREPYKYRWGAIDRWTCRRVFKRAERDARRA